MIQQFLAAHNFHLIQLIIVAIGYLMPIPLAWLALNLWHHYRQEKFISGIEWAVLEIQVPRDVVKSLAAMELIFSNAFYHKGSKGFWGQFMRGDVWLWFSLEIVSIDGRVHFFIRTPTRIRNLVESQIYAQFPQAKVVEVDDYAFHVSQYSKNGQWYNWGCEFTKEKHDARPIKTYRDFGSDLDTGVKEEFKIDPLTPTIEFLGSLSRGEQVWIQIVVRQNTKMYHSHKTGKHVDIYAAAQEEIDAISKPYAKKLENGELSSTALLPEGPSAIVKGIVRQLNLIHFDCGIRLIVLARKDSVTEAKFNETRRASRLLFRQFASPASNELKRINSTDGPFMDPSGMATTKMRKRQLDFYRLRVFFHPPLQYSFEYPKIFHLFLPSGRPEIFVLSSEELATLWHFPGLVSETPSFKRIESKIAKPPANLPL